MPKKVTNNSTRLLRIGVSVKDKAQYVTFMPGENIIDDDEWARCMENKRARAWCEKGTLKSRTGKIEKDRALLTVEDVKGKKATTKARAGAGLSREEKDARKKQEAAAEKAAEKEAKKDA